MYISLENCRLWRGASGEAKYPVISFVTVLLGFLVEDKLAKIIVRSVKIGVDTARETNLEVIYKWSVVQ